MHYISTFSAIADALDLAPNTLTKFHLPHGIMLEYMALVKEFYKKLLHSHICPNSSIHYTNLQPFFHHVDLLFSVLLSAGGDAVIRPRVSEYSCSIEHVFEEIMIENTVKILLDQIVWIVQKIGKTFSITSMESLKID